MPNFPVTPSKAEDLRRRMAALGITEGTLAEHFFCPNRGRARKKGAAVAVHLRHGPSQLEVRCQKSTSQPLNRFLARRALVRMLEKRAVGNSPLNPKQRTPLADETPEKHMMRMFTKGFEKDIAQPYPLPSQKLLGAGDLPPKLISVLGEREVSH